MTATPHSGKEEDFHLFLALLDSDRFVGRNRDCAGGAVEPRKFPLESENGFASA
jgi:hypothetical protein